MLIDHIGYVLFPKITILRILGRLAFPIFSFMIAEGCHYTKNKIKYFLTVFILGAFCQGVYAVFDSSSALEFNILITFSISILIVYALQTFKESFFEEKVNYLKQILSLLSLISLIVGAYFLSKYVTIDYGFWGTLAPAFLTLIRVPKGSLNKVWQSIDNHFTRLLFFGGCLVLVAFSVGGIQIYSLLALPLLLLYSGKRGKYKLKYFFYIFYPTHLAIIQGVAYLVQWL
jgi:hypothetical protein